MARSFNGTSDYIDLGNITAMNPTTPFTLGCWAKVASTTAFKAFITRGRSSSRGYEFGSSSSAAPGTLAFTKSAVVVIDSLLGLTANAWMFYACVVTSTNVHFFIMSAAGVVTTVDKANSSAFAGTPAEGAIGADYNSAGTGRQDWMSGSLANITAHMGVALTDKQLQALAWMGAQGVSVKPTLDMPLFGNPTTEPDYSGNKTGGTLTGTAIVNHPPVMPRMLHGRRSFQPMPV